MAFKVINYFFPRHGIGVCVDGDRQVCQGGITVRVHDMVPNASSKDDKALVIRLLLLVL
jgi:hypothetical protein